MTKRVISIRIENESSGLNARLRQEDMSVEMDGRGFPIDTRFMQEVIRAFKACYGSDSKPRRGRDASMGR